MSNEPRLMQFMDAVAENTQLREEFVALAARHGIDFTQGELDDEQLDSVAGGVGFSAQIKGWESVLASVGDDASLGNIDLQNAMQKQQQMLQTLSNVSKMMHSTAMAVVRKIG